MASRLCWWMRRARWSNPAAFPPSAVPNQGTGGSRALRRAGCTGAPCRPWAWRRAKARRGCADYRAFLKSRSGLTCGRPNTPAANGPNSGYFRCGTAASAVPGPNVPGHPLDVPQQAGGAGFRSIGLSAAGEDHRSDLPPRARSCGAGPAWRQQAPCRCPGPAAAAGCRWRTAG